MSGPAATLRVFEIVWRDAERTSARPHGQRRSSWRRVPSDDRILGDRASGHTAAQPRLTFGRARAGLALTRSSRGSYGLRLEPSTGATSRGSRVGTPAALTRLPPQTSANGIEAGAGAQLNQWH